MIAYPPVAGGVAWRFQLQPSTLPKTWPLSLSETEVDPVHLMVALL